MEWYWVLLIAAGSVVGVLWLAHMTGYAFQAGKTAYNLSRMVNRNHPMNRSPYPSDHGDESISPEEAVKDRRFFLPKTDE